MQHDVFISHASEDKDTIVRELATKLAENHIDVWYDEFSLTVGDSLQASIDRGLASSRFGIVVLSPNFIQKPWTKRELQGLVARQILGKNKVILPVWHNISAREVMEFSPPLADTFALNSSNSIEAIIDDLMKVLKPDGSPLLIARDILQEKALQPPVVTDDWWLDIVELKQSEFINTFYNPYPTPWKFPLPCEDELDAQSRGRNIAYTALQLDWIEVAAAESLCQISHPNKVHNFIQKHPGLIETCQQYPEVLALYAPQLTLPEYDNGFSDLFDSLLAECKADAYAMPGYGKTETIDGEEPLCGELICWRHPTLGNYACEEIASSFVDAHTGHYYRQKHSGFSCLIWTLSEQSSWLPARIKNVICEGFKKKTFPWSHSLDRDYMHKSQDNRFLESLFNKPKSRFRYSRAVKSDLEEIILKECFALDLPEPPSILADKFIEFGYVDAYFEERIQIKKARRR